MRTRSRSNRSSRALPGSEKRRLRFEPLEERRLLAIVVDTLVDENDGVGVGDISLRDAIAAATTPGEIIIFSVSGTILLDHGELVIDKSLTINGPGANLLTIDAQHDSRVMNIDEGNDTNYLNVGLSGVTLTGGSELGDGGAIFSQETLSVVDSVITGNAAQWGGGIFNGYYGELTLLRSEVSGNTATTSGGGVYNYDGVAYLRESTISGNDAPDAAGIRNTYYGDLLLANSTVSGNIAGGNAGGLLNEGYTVVQESSISGNEAATGGGIFNTTNSYMAIERSTISGNTATGAGGGIHNLSATVEVFDSTISGNMGSYGGGLYIAGEIDYSTIVNNSTISGNTATIAGGGIYNFQGTAYIEHSTITNNTAPDDMGGGVGVWDDPNTSLTYVRSTIIAGNIGSDLFVFDENFNSFVSEGYNLIGVGAGDDVFVETGDQIGVTDPKLDPIANNGGPTMTHALLGGSPALDAGNPLAVIGEDGVPEFDQRSMGFDRIVGTAIDIGAYEAQAAPPALVGDYNDDGSVNAADYVVWRDTLGSTTNLAANGDDSNNVIDEADYDVWFENFGAPLGAGSGARGAGASIAGDLQPPAIDAAFALFDDSRFGSNAKGAAALGESSNSPRDDSLLLLATSIADSGREGEDDAAAFDYDREESSEEDESLSEPALIAGLFDAWP